MNNLLFQFYRTPRILFGEGQRNRLNSLIIPLGSPVLLIHSTHSLPEEYKRELSEKLDKAGIEIHECLSSGEPSPEFIDQIVNKYRENNIKAVIAIGGGSVIDAGKAISAMIPIQDSVLNYLEVVGNKNHPGIKIPFFAIPTTAGTGAEASSNAVLSSTGSNGFKRSIRHENFVPDYAIVDPQLMLSCPDSVTAACGMDALTQLLESYVSPKASQFTDSLIEKAFPLVGKNLLAASGSGKNDLEVRTAMAYAALISGITLANAGLGIVHGLASAIGGLSPVPHGVICGTLLEVATRVNIKKLKVFQPSSEALKKYCRAGFLLKGRTDDTDGGCDLLIEQLNTFTKQSGMPYLSDFGITRNDVERIIMDSGNKNNPVKLDADDMRHLLLERIRE